jgi:hypothetical protein
MGNYIGNGENAFCGGRSKQPLARGGAGPRASRAMALRVAQQSVITPVVVAQQSFSPGAQQSFSPCAQQPLPARCGCLRPPCSLSLSRPRVRPRLRPALAHTRNATTLGALTGKCAMRQHRRQRAAWRTDGDTE